jgi:hypothetical protein
MMTFCALTVGFASGTNMAGLCFMTRDNLAGLGLTALSLACGVGMFLTSGEFAL